MKLKSLSLDDILPYLIVLIPAFMFFWHKDENGTATIDLWWSKWFGLGVILSGCFSLFVHRQTRSIACALSVLTFCLSAIYISEWRQGLYANYAPPHKLALVSSARQDLMFFSLSLIALLTIPVRSLRGFVPALGLLCLLDSLLILQKVAIGEAPFWRYGFVAGNGSMDACFIAYTWPILLYWFKFKPHPILLLPPAAVILSTSEMGLAAMIMATFFLFVTGLIKNHSHKKLFVPPILLIWLMASCALFYVSWNEIVDTTGRSQMWRAAYEFWGKNFNPLFGAGQGTTTVFLPFIQRTENLPFHRGVFVWMHNDFLQLLFEQGLIGLCLGLWTFATASMRAIGRPHLLVACLTYGFTCVGNLSAHWAVTGITGLIILVLIFREEDPKWKPQT